MAFGDPNYVMIFKGRSRIGSLLPDCTLEETYEDRLQVTSHPVEKGANISDHAFLLPKSLEMRIGWSDSNGKNDSWSINRYEELLKLQASREPLQVTTGKRLYKDMLIMAISVTNDQRTKYAVMAIARLSEVKFANVVTNVSVNRENMRFPQSTSEPTNAGSIQPQQRITQPSPIQFAAADLPPDSATAALLGSTPA